MKINIRTISLFALIMLYLSAGINHFINSEFYEKIMPSYIPFHKASILVSGICEIMFALLLIPILTRKLAARLIIAMLIVFFVVHIQMLIDYWTIGGVMLFVAFFRIPLQFVLIWWAYTFTKNPQPK